jgi:protein-disulfide isomerase
VKPDFKILKGAISVMTTIKRLFVLPLFMLAFITASTAGAADAAFTDAQKTEIEKIFKDYLTTHPEMIMESLQAYQQKQALDKQAMAETKISENIGALTAKDLPSAGNPDGDVTVVEFYDYNCGYCKHAYTDVQKVLETDKNVRFVFKDLAILGPTSETAARWSVAAHKQGKFFEYHAALMQHKGSIDEAALEKVGTDVGLDIAQLKKDAASEEIKTSVDKSREMAASMQIHGTPAFIINGKLYPGYLGEDGLPKAIEEARKGKKE